VGAVDEITRFPENHLADESRALRAMLVAREEAFKRAMASDDPAVLKTFLQAYPKGVQTDELRGRLRRLEPGPAWQPSRRGLVTACVLGVVVVGSVGVWPAGSSRVAGRRATPYHILLLYRDQSPRRLLFLRSRIAKKDSPIVLKEGASRDVASRATTHFLF
jgi:hypothetical protein